MKAEWYKLILVDDSVKDGLFKFEGLLIGDCGECDIEENMNRATSIDLTGKYKYSINSDYFGRFLELTRNLEE